MMILSSLMGSAKIDQLHLLGVPAHDKRPWRIFLFCTKSTSFKRKSSSIPIREREGRQLYSSHSTHGDRPSAVLMKVVVHRYITRLHLLGVPVTKGCGDALFYLNKRTTYQRQGS